MEEDLTTMNLDELISRGRDIKDSIEHHNDVLKKLKQDWDTIEQLMMQICDDQGITRTGNDDANISISEQEYANVEDWDSLYSYIIDNNAMHLLQRRIASKAAVEYRTAGEELPGVRYYSDRKLSFRRK